MDRQCKHKQTTDPPHPTAHSGTFTFFQPRLATALKNVKEPKFTNRTPTTPSFSIAPGMYYVQLIGTDSKSLRKSFIKK
jgi:hypothetical protein